MSQNHSVGGNWHGGLQANCKTCNPIKPVVQPVAPVVTSVPVAVVEEKKSKKKVGV